MPALEHASVVAGTTSAPPRFASLDAWVLVRPATAFRFVAASRPDPIPSALWTACRRPVFIALSLGCIVSLAAFGALTLRIVAPAAIYWSYVPITEALALVALTWRRRARWPLPVALDAFFAGHGAWTLYGIALGGLLAFVPPQHAWTILVSWAVWTLPVVLGWSAYTDFCFFRAIYGASRAAALRDVVLHRLLTWTVVVVVFAVPVPDASGLGEEVAEVVSELFR